MKLTPEVYDLITPLGLKLEPIDQSTPAVGTFPQRNHYWKMYLTKQGQGNHLIDFKQHTYSEHSVHFILPHQAHLLTTVPGQQGYVIRFHEQYIERNPENNSFLAELYNYKNHLRTPNAL